jgi:integrase
MHIFFHSGARLTELMRLQVQDVDLRNQVFKLIVKKGRMSKEVLRLIKDIALEGSSCRGVPIALRFLARVGTRREADPVLPDHEALVSSRQG